MIDATKADVYYQATLRSDASFEGVFFLAVRTTGVFCRPTCPARKPNRENCEFFATAKEALLAAYRPCKRCRPLSPPGEASDVVRKLVEAVEHDPARRWRDADFRAIDVDASTARRQFKKRYGMTFVEYARSRRMGLAMEQIRKGEAVIDAQLNAGYASGSGFRDAFAKIMGSAPAKGVTRVMQAAWLDTPLGPMLAIGDDDALHLLEFVERRGLEREVERMRTRLRTAIVPGCNAVIEQIERELSAYFAGDAMTFATPLAMTGSDFQKTVWDSLTHIPPGETRSYADLAREIGRPTAVRAVGRANGSNQLAIVIPCHRVITADGELGGYGGGIVRKQWLLEHERKTRV